MTVWKWSIAALALAALGEGSLAQGSGPQTQAQGTVFDDRNGNAKRDPGEAGLPSVLISNGRQITRTDQKGGYRIAAPERGFVFVIQPPYYRVAHDRNFTPQFFHLFWPAPDQTERDFLYPGPQAAAAPRGPLDFPLRKISETDSVRALAFADPQPATDAELDYVRDDFILEAAGETFDFAIGHGDLMHDDLSLFPRYQALMGALKRPVWSVAGNHDVNFDSPDDARSLSTFNRLFGPGNYAFMAGKAVFIALDNVHYDGVGSPAKFPQPNPRGMGTYRGRIGSEGLGFVENLLKEIPPDRLVFVSLHIPLKSSWEGDNINTADRDALLALLCARPHAAVLTGHMHVAEHHELACPKGALRASVPQHILGTVSGSWWSGPFDARGIPVAEQSDGAPNGYYLLDIKGTDYRLEFRAQGFGPGFQMRMSLDSAFHRFNEYGLRDYRWGEIGLGRLSQDQARSSFVYLNIFNGGPKSQATLNVGDRTLKMEKVLANDPFAEELFLRTKDAKIGLKASPSTHLWRVRLPSDLAPGAHLLEGVGTDQFGQEFRVRRIVEISKTD